MVETVLDEERLLLGLLLLVLSGRGSGRGKTCLLLLLSLRAVPNSGVLESSKQTTDRGDILVQELEELSRSVLVEGVGKLGDGRRDLETLAEDDLLALEADILRPLDEASEVLDGLDILACARETIP